MGNSQSNQSINSLAPLVDKDRAKGLADCPFCLEFRCHAWDAPNVSCFVREKYKILCTSTCPICMVVLCALTEYLDEFSLSSKMDVTDIILYRSKASSNKPLILCLEGREMSLEFEILAESEPPPISEPWSAIRRWRSLPAASLKQDPIYLELLQSWIDKCNREHIQSKQCISDAHLPQRVLDVEGRRDGFVCIVERPDIVDRYICLSHCWGSGDMIKTTRRNLEDHRRGIAWDSLAPNFQDCILVAEFLNIKYVWIDALCIIQDDPDDWNAQSVRMEDIYGGSYLTVASGRSSNPHGGIFANLDSYLALKEKKIQCDIPGLPGISMRVQGQHPTWFTRGFDSEIVTKKPGILKHLTQLPLLSRGWAFQEQILPSRLVVFGPRDVTWSCKYTRYCSCFPDEHDHTLNPDRWVSPNAAFDASLHQLGYNFPLDRWYENLYTYSHLNLTFSRDRLPALAGIAKRFQGAPGTGRYLAGLWEKDIARGLSWTAGLDEESVLKDRPIEYSAPSWSWASVDNSIARHLLTRIDKPAITLMDCFIAPVGEDPTGALKGAFLRLQGKIFNVNVQLINEEQLIDETDGTSRLERILLVKDGDIVPFLPDGCPFCHEPGFLRDGMTLYCLLLNTVPEDFGKEAIFLVLREVLSEEYSVSNSILTPGSSIISDNDYTSDIDIWKKYQNLKPSPYRVFRRIGCLANTTIKENRIWNDYSIDFQWWMEDAQEVVIDII